MFKQRSLQEQTGSSLIEVLLATAITAIVLTSLAIGLTYSIKTTSEAKYRSIATKLLEEGMELFNRQRALNSWVDFRVKYPGDPPVVYVICNDDVISSNTSCVGKEIEQSKIIFSRTAMVTHLDAERFKVEITVNWDNGAHAVKTTKIFKEYQSP